MEISLCEEDDDEDDDEEEEEADGGEDVKLCLRLCLHCYVSSISSSYFKDQSYQSEAKLTLLTPSSPGQCRW